MSAKTKEKAKPDEAKKAGKKGEIQIDPAPPNRLKEFYQTEVVPQLMKRFSYTSVMQVPRLEKVVVNMGVGDALQNIKLLDAAAADLEIIAGQKPAHPAGQEVDRELQAARRRAHRLHGHPARRADVGVPGAPDDRGHPPDPRLPRALAASPSTAGGTTPSGSRSR